MMTHAWLIIAHNEFGILQRLVSALDAPECDIYIHIDRKVRELPRIKTDQSRLILLNNRIDVRWGSVSQIKCEMALLEAAVADHGHDYYHIISGTTLPLKPLPQINQFFENNFSNCVLSGFGRSGLYQESLKVRKYNLFLHNYASGGFKGKASQFLWKSSIAIQRLLGIEVNKEKTFHKASNWLTLSQEAVDYIISRKKEILKTYRYSFCGDEYFIPSVLMDSPLKDKVVNSDKYLLHNISRSNASTYRIDEYDDLCETGYLFARKFTER